jgi:hypothetical protein
MLQSFVDLASRATRVDLLRPRFYENDFSNVKTEPDGTIAVHNARYKTRIRASKQVRDTQQRMSSCHPALKSFLDALGNPLGEWGRCQCDDKRN